MKTLFLKNRILSILILLVLTVTLNSCSSNDTIKSFLQKQADSEWKFSDINAGLIIYARINNDVTNPLDTWFSEEDALCFIFGSVDDNGNVEVLENSDTELKIKIVDDGNPTEHGIFTLTVNGDILTVKIERFEDDVLTDQELFILQRTSDEVDGLEICPVPL